MIPQTVLARRTRLLGEILALSLGSLLSVLLLTTAVASLRWRIVHDSPIMLYLGYLIDTLHRVPYRDIFDMNLPGSYLAYVLIGRLSGYTDLGFRLVDLATLALILSATWVFLRSFGRRVAWIGCVLFGVFYLQLGSYNSLQREFIMLVPLSAALALAVVERWPHSRLKYGLVGGLLGYAATIKPHSLIALPLFVMFALFIERGLPGAARPQRTQALLSMLAGCTIPPVMAAGYLVITGGWPYFLDMARNYWPLYGQLSGSHEALVGSERFPYLVSQYVRLGGYRWWLVPGLLGIAGALAGSQRFPRQRAIAALLAGLAVVYSVYPALQGQFWQYHWIPFCYFVILMGSLAFCEADAGTGGLARLLVLTIAAVSIFAQVHPLASLRANLAAQPAVVIKNGRVDAIAAYLAQNLRSGDTVQPLDWTGGAVQAMLITRAPIATRFVYDFHFYHNLSTPYIQQLRLGFLQDLQTARPGYIVEITSLDKPWVSGPDTSRSFPQLEQFIHDWYRVEVKRPDYTIYKWQPGHTAN